MLDASHTTRGSWHRMARGARESDTGTLVSKKVAYIYTKENRRESLPTGFTLQ